MSDAKWCDQGQHAYSAAQEGAQTLTFSQRVKDDYGNVHVASMTKDVCAECAAKMQKVLEISESSAS